MHVLAPALVGGLLFAALAAGEPTPLRLQYEAPGACPDEQAFYGAVESRTALVRRAREGETARVFRIHIAFDRSGSVGEVHAVEDGRDTASRRVEAPTCDEVVQALALTVALSVDPMASITPTRPPPAPVASASSSAPPPTPPPKRLPAAPPVASSRRSIALEIGVQGTVAHPLDAFLHTGGALMLGLDWPYAGVMSPSVELSVGQLRNDWFSTPTDAAVTLTMAAVTLCPLRFEFLAHADARLCARGEGGILAARGRDVLVPRTSTRSWWAAGLAGQGRLAFSSNIELKLDAGVIAPLVRREFVIDDPPRTAADTRSWSPFGGLGVAFRL